MCQHLNPFFKPKLQPKCFLLNRLPGVVDVLKVEEGAGGEDGEVVLPQQEGVQTETTLQ